MKKTPRQYAREKAMIAIYQHLLTNTTEKEGIQFLKHYRLLAEHEELMNFSIYLYHTTLKNKDAYIQHISKYLKKNWQFDRLGYLEQAILLLATCELLDENLNKEIVINEAILLSKAYLDEDMYRYINGVLNQLA